ncbi:MAG TPA: phosphotransferase, partial [Methylophilaceae bacterium]|nr:phosphotransferase [Methylophilaceae bacterium]
MDTRQQELNDWLKLTLPDVDFTLTTASADASFRRYFRVHAHNETFIAMDAPPPQENCEPFVRIAKLFGDAGLNVPKVIAQDLERGFLL